MVLDSPEVVTRSGKFIVVRHLIVNQFKLTVGKVGGMSGSPNWVSLHMHWHRKYLFGTGELVTPSWGPALS